MKKLVNNLPGHGDIYCFESADTIFSSYYRYLEAFAAGMDIPYEE